MSVLFACMAVLLSFAVPMDEARASSGPRVWLKEIDPSIGGPNPVVKLGDRIAVNLVVQGWVRVTGMPYITLNIGSQKRRANFYVHPVKIWPRLDLAVDTLWFIYSVNASDRDTDGVTIDAAAGITLNGGTIKSADGNRDANLHISTELYYESAGFYYKPERAPLGKYEHDHPVRVDGSVRSSSYGHTSYTRKAPNLPRWWSTSLVNLPKTGDTYKLGEEILVEVLCSPAVTVTGTPQFGIEIGERVRYANYDAARSYGDRLVFSYVVQASDSDDDGIRQAGFITLNGGRIVIQGSTTPINLGDGYVPSDFFGVHGPYERDEPDPLYPDPPSWKNKAVKVDGSSVGSSGRAPRVIRIGNSNPKVAKARARRFGGEAATFGRGESILSYVQFNGPVAVEGTPQLKLTIGSPRSVDVVRWADYDAALSAPERGRLVFSYTVQASDIDTNGILAGPMIALNGGRITSADGVRDANLYGVFPGYQAQLVLVDGRNEIPALRVSSIEFETAPRYESTYRLSEQIRVTVSFSGPVRVTGTPQLGLTIGSRTRQASYDAVRSGVLPIPEVLSGPSSPLPSLVFTYKVQATDLDADGISVAANALALNGGTISRTRDARSTAASLSHAAVTTDATRKVDGRLRLLVELSPVRYYNTDDLRDGTYRLDEEMLFELYAEPPVTVTGTPRLKMFFGEGNQDDYALQTAGWDPLRQTTRYADYDAALSSPNRLVFSYTIRAADSDADGIVVPDAPITLNGGTIADRADPTNHADLRKPAGGGIQVSSCGPWSGSCKVDGGGTTHGGGSPAPRLRVNTVRLMGTPASGVTYRLGEQIQVAVTFSEAVTVTGTPQVGLTIGSQTRQAVYDATRSEGALLEFSYYVQATDADADGIGIAANALTLNGGTISRTSDSTTAAALGHAGVGTDDTRKVDGSTDVVEHGASREQATLLVLSARTTGEVGETGQENDVQVGVATARSAEVAGALEQTGDADYFRVEVPGAGRLTVETTGATDTVGALLGATGQALTEDDDGGTESNFRVERSVQAGTYYVAVTGGESERVVGLYTLAVRFTPARGGTPVGNVAPPPGGNTPPRGSRPPAGSTPPARGATGDREARQPTALWLNTETTGRLDRAGEVDRFRVEVQEAGTVTVEASGAAAPIAYFGAGDEPSLPARAGVRAVQAAWPVTAGTYHVAVVGGPGRTRTGAYTVAVRFTAASEAGPLRATLLNVAPAQAWVHFYCGRAQDAEAAACTAQVQCGQPDGGPIAWDVAVAPETIVSYWPGRRAADGTSANFAAALVAAGRSAEAAGQRTTCRVFSPDPLEVRAYTQVAGELVPVASPPAPLDATAPTRVATLLNVAPAQAWVHLACRKTQTAEGEPVDPCQARLQCGQQAGTPVAWDVDVAAETTLTYGPGGASDDMAAALVAAGKTETEARRRTTCQVFSRDPLDAWAYTRVGGDLVSVANPPAPVDAGAPTRVATLLNVAPAHAWVHFYCRKAHDPAAEIVDPCNVRLQCGQQAGTPVAWDVTVAPETIVTYWPGRTAADGTPADLVAALIGAGKTEAEARRRTTCQVFSTDPVDVRGYTRVGGAVMPVANPPVMSAADAPPTRLGTLLNLSPAQAWVHFYCRKAHQPDAETADPCTVQLQCGQQDGSSVAWGMEVAPETIVSYWPGRTAPDGTPDNLAAALVAAGKTEAEARRRTTCQVFSADPVDVRGYTQLGETVIPVKN